MYPLLKRASGLMVLHMKPAGDSLFNAEWDEQDNCSAFHYNTIFLNHRPPPPLHHLGEN